MCGGCANFKKMFKSIGECPFANKRSVSLYTVKIRNIMEKELGKKAIHIILSTESDCPLKIGKDTVEESIHRNNS